MQSLPQNPIMAIPQVLSHNPMKLILILFTAFLLIPAASGATETNDLSVLTLADANKIALHNHPQIAAANYRALAAEEAYKETRAGYYPNADLFADAVGANQEGSRILAGGINNPSVYDRAAGGIAISQLVTDFGHTANLAASSKSESRAQSQTVNATREQILLQVDTAYLGALQARAVLNVAQQTLDTRQLLFDQVSVLASNQLKSSLDVSFARVAIQEAKLLVERAQNNADAAMAALVNDLGERYQRNFDLLNPPPASMPDTNDVSLLVQTALRDRPELLSLRDEDAAAQQYARSQRDARLPTINAFGVAGVSPDHASQLANNYAAAGLQLSLPLFAGGYYTARQHEAELKSQADEELLRAAEDNIVRDVHVAWLNLNNAVAQLQTTAELVHNAAEAYELADARYKIGSSSIVELSQAQLSLTSAQITDADSRYNLLIEQANLQYQIGALH